MALQNSQETETKLYVTDLSVIAQRLEALGATLVHPRVYERNVRYENAERSLTPNGLVVRLRQDSRTRLTYKGKNLITNGISSREELEVEVSDFDTMDLMLARLGYTPDMVYEKYRTTYQLDGAEIVLDELPFAHFIEIEADTEQIEALITRLGLESAERMGISYASLFELIKQRMGLAFRDLTFANFEGMRVPKSAFYPPET